MSLTRDHGLIVFECDACGDVLETETHDFGEARSTLRNAEWLIVKMKNEWMHFCSRECRDDSQQIGVKQ